MFNRLLKKEIKSSRSLQKLMKVCMGKLIILNAACRGKKFYCSALQGELGDICINSDLSVSCNCYDIDGKGHIGNLKEQNLSQIFSSNKANKLRKTLASGRLPLLDCVRCKSLSLVDRKLAIQYLHNYHPPNVLIAVENTSRCNLNCLSCDREKISSIRSSRNMTLDDIKLVSKNIKENKIKTISFYNWGEPFLSDNIRKQLKIIKEENPETIINTSTNGLLLDSDEKREAALYFDHIYFSIDGSTKESVNKYQRGSDFNKVFSNMKELESLKLSRGLNKPVIEWKYILFRWNDNKFLTSNALRLAKEAKIDRVSFWFTYSPIYGISWKTLLRSFFRKEYRQIKTINLAT